MPAIVNHAPVILGPETLAANSAKVTTLAQPQASVFTWTGGGEANHNWRNPKNWRQNAIPTNGASLEFPSGISGRSNDDVPGLELREIAIFGTGYAFTARSGVQYRTAAR